MLRIASVRACGLAAVLASAACGSAGPAQPAPAPRPVASDAAVVDRGPPLDQDLPKLVERSLALYRDVAAAFESSGKDCGAATDKLHRLAGAYRDVVAANAKVLHDGRAGELRDALAPHDAELSAAAGTVMHAMTMASCASNPQFTRALDALFAPPDAPGPPAGQ